jgi:light-regulated signal transduction histidine kinase (bacteriophytochrome)
VASHDLKEPLRAVSGCVQLLRNRYQGKLDESADELIAHATDGAARMEKLIDGLLAYSRIATRGGKFETVECSKVLHMALLNLAAAIQESGGVVTQDPLPAVNGDPQQLVSLFQNLVGNALKFRKVSPPHVHLGAERNGTDWRFSVRDNGIGIDSQYFERIFGVFQRLHTRSEYPGTGIGLAVCKKIVERHGGKIWVESLPGEGTTFYFSLPGAKERQQERESQTGDRGA